MPNCLVEENYVYTNKMPCGYMRAPGHLQAFFASESQADLVAKRLGMDPVEFRRMNFMRDGDTSPLGEVIPHVKATETLGRALGRIRFSQAEGQRKSAAVAPLRIGYRRAASRTRL